MSRHRTQGFSLLEVQVGLLLLTLIVVGFTRLVGAQESLVRDLEDWCRGDPVFVLTSPTDEHERVAGLPAGLALREEDNRAAISADLFGKDAATTTSAAVSWANELLITHVSRDLEPQQAQAVLQVEPIKSRGDVDEEDGEDEDDDKDKDKDKDKDDKGKGRDK